MERCSESEREERVPELGDGSRAPPRARERVPELRLADGDLNAPLTDGRALTLEEASNDE